MRPSIWSRSAGNRTNRLAAPMEQTQPQIDPYVNDPTHWATSMAHHAELMLPCLDATGAQLVVEVGAFAGDLTRLLADWAEGSGARVLAIDPSPQDQLVALERERERVELIRATSLDAIPRIPLPQVVVIDGDHNYHVVSEELRLISRAGLWRGPAAAALPRRGLAARPPRPLLRPRADSRPASPPDRRRGQGAGPRRSRSAR